MADTRRSDEDMRRIAAVDDEAVNDAADYWRRHAPEKYRTILDAKEHE